MLRALPFVVLLTLGTGCVIHTAGTATVRVHDQYVAPSYVVVSAPPPPLVAAVTPGYQPSSDAIWIEGYWDWQGSGWVWVEGHWETSRPGQEWEHGVCVVVEGGGYQYHPGHWRPRDVAPPPIYRAEGTVQVHVGTSRVRRVPPSQIGHAPTVVVAAGPSRGPSANVTVRPATVVVQPSHPTVVVQPSHPTVVVQPNRPTVTVQPEPRPATVNVQPSRPTTTVTVRPEPRPTVVQPSRPTTTVTVQPSQPVRPSTTVTVQPEPRPNQPTRPSVQVQPTTVAPNTNVRPSVQAQPTTVAPNTNVRPSVQAQPTTVAPNTNVRPTVQAQPTTVAPNTNVRPTVQAQPTTVAPNTNVRPTVQAQPTTVAPNTNVRPTTPTTTVVTTPNNPVRPNPVVTTPRPTVTQGQVQCAPVISRVPQNGFLVLRGRGLGSVSAVTIGSQSAAIATRTDEEVRARLMGLSGGGAVSIIVGGQTYSCGRVDITGP